MADFSSLLHAMTNLSDKNLRANTANAPITSHKIIEPLDNQTLFAVGINSKALSKIIAAAATNANIFFELMPAATAVTAIARPSGILCSDMLRLLLIQI